MIEKEILDDNELYYNLLANTDFYGDYQGLIGHFTRSVYRSYVKTEEMFRERDLLSSDLDELSKRILIKARRKGDWFDLKNVRIWCEGESDYRLRTRLDTLVENGVISEKGRTRGKRYIFRDPLEDIKSQLTG